MCTLYNLGCKLNQYEGYSLQKKFADQDNVVIVNTCCVTALAAQKSRKKFRYALKNHPGSTVIATGCACTLKPQDYRSADRVIDTIHRNQLIQEIFPEPPRSRYFLKVQDGCTERCTYCVVSVIRNQLASKSISRIVREIIWARSRGYNEIVLVGANLGLFGLDTGTSLPGLFHRLSRVKDLPRIRLSSIEPRFITDDLIASLNQVNVCRHFHIPIQSADPHVLKQMGRRYNTRSIERVIRRIAKTFKHVAIGVDVIVGFPNENEQRFENTRKFIINMPITHAHIFPYSPRPGTKAYTCGDPIMRSTKRERLWVLKDIVADKSYKFRQSMRGYDFAVIVEQTRQELCGLTDNYVRIQLDGSLSIGSLINARVIGITKTSTRGKIIPDSRNI